MSAFSEQSILKCSSVADGEKDRGQRLIRLQKKPAEAGLRGAILEVRRLRLQRIHAILLEHAQAPEKLMVKKLVAAGAARAGCVYSAEPIGTENVQDSLAKRHGWARPFNRISLGIVDTYPSQRLKKRFILYPFRYRLYFHYVAYMINGLDHGMVNRIIDYALDECPVDF